MKKILVLLFFTSGLMLSVHAATTGEIAPLPEGNVPDAVELAVLQDIYTTMGGSGWTTKTNWPTTWPTTATSANYATWYGITVTNGDITTIALGANGLTGTIPSSIGNLTELQRLELNTNAITGAIPASIGNLTKLYYLYLASNQLTSIPSEIGNATALKQIYLHANNITNLPSTITNLVNVWDLELHQNQITGTIPTNIGNMTSLQVLWLFSNHLSGSIPTSIGNLTSLQSLNLNSNQLSGSIPSSIGNLTSLLKLYVGANQLTGSLPPQIGLLTNLRELGINSNQMSGSLPSEIGNMTNLQTIDIDQNQFSGPIPATIANLTHLDQFYARQNALSGSIPDFTGTALTLLYLPNNQLTGSIPSTLGNLTNLRQLALGGNQLTGSVPSSLGNLSHLTDLSIDGNHLTGQLPTSLANITPLINIYVVANNFTFSDLLPLYTLNSHMTYVQQARVDVAKTVNVQIGTTLHLSAPIDRTTTPASTYRWYRVIGQWQSFTPVNDASTSGHTLDITGLTAADDGAQFGYIISNSAMPATTLQSNLVTVHMVTCIQPTADFTTSVDTFTYTFTPNLTGTASCSLSYLWEFGDGETSTDATPSHIYNATGTYAAKLTLTYQCGECDSSQVVVTKNVDVTNTSICTSVFCDGVGGVGIGTMRTQGYRLSVDGKVRAASVKVYPQTQWSDFVFEDKYNLRPLSEVENFIKMNRHLPEIPSATEVEKNGVELGSMDAKLLQKIEELTLYMIQSEKRADTLEKKLEELTNENKRLKALLEK